MLGLDIRQRRQHGKQGSERDPEQRQAVHVASAGAHADEVAVHALCHVARAYGLVRPCDDHFDHPCESPVLQRGQVAQAVPGAPRAPKQRDEHGEQQRVERDARAQQGNDPDRPAEQRQ